jgi:hypothetical protein
MYNFPKGYQIGWEIELMKKLPCIFVILVMALIGCAPRLVRNPVVISKEILLIDKNFNDAAEPWCSPQSDDLSDIFCQDGELHLIDKGNVGVSKLENGDYVNFKLQLQIRLVGANGAYGILFRRSVSPPNMAYVFEIHPDGKDRLFLAGQNQTNSVVIPWTESPAIQQGGVANLLGVTAQGNCLTLLVNGSTLTSFTEGHFYADKGRLQGLNQNSYIYGEIGPVALEGGHVVVHQTRLWDLPGVRVPLDQCPVGG